MAPPTPLADVFAAGVPEGLRAALEPAPDLQVRLQRFWERARAAWPEVRLDAAGFMRHVAARLPVARDPAAELEQLQAGDLYLAYGCSCGDRDALAAFDRRFVPPMTAYLRRRDALPGFDDDFKQQLRARLLVAEDGALPRIAGYGGRAPLAAWLRVAAARLAINMRGGRRAAEAPVAEGSAPALRTALPDPELVYLRSRYGAVLREAVAAAIGRLDARHATVLRFFYLQSMTARAIAATMRISQHRRAMGGRGARRDPERDQAPAEGPPRRLDHADRQHHPTGRRRSGHQHRRLPARRRRRLTLRASAFRGRPGREGCPPPPEEWTAMPDAPAHRDPQQRSRGRQGLAPLNARVLVAAIALLAPALARAEDAPRTRLAHVGLQLDGGWSFLAHEQQEPHAVLVAVAEPVAELRDRARAKVGPGVPIFDDYVRMLDEVRPDAVVATLPNSEHLALVRACARRRVHVWFQKPMATSARDAREMQRLAEQAGITLMINYFRLWAPPVQALADRLARGDLGTIQRVVVQEGYGPEHEKKMSRHYLGYFWKPELQGGGSLIEQGTYGLHWAVWLLGRPTRVWATAKKLRRDAAFTAEDESWTVLDYPGATAISQGAWSAPDTVPGGTSGIQIVGTRGVARMAGGRWTISVAGGPPEPQPLDGPEPPPERRNGVAHFVDCIRHRRPIDRAHSAALNVLVSEVTEAAYQAVRTGAPVRLP